MSAHERRPLEYEASHGFRYSAVFVSRWDLVWLSEKAAGIMAGLAASLAESSRGFGYKLFRP